MTRATRLTSSLCALALAGALAFGAAQAFASAPVAGDEAARTCTALGCNRQCAPTGGRCLSGICQCF
jgi:hypothetical protein